MCGFFGSTSLCDTELARQALEALRHRGPDAESIMELPGGVLGHVRLSILDVSDSHQPMRVGLHAIVFNGEIYNFQRLRANLGGQWQTQGDTEVVMRLLSERGIAALPELDGMFAFAYLGEELILARDPIGIKPLYTLSNEQGTFFASEIKGLLHLPGTVLEFPAGTWWSPSRGFVRYFQLDDLHWNASLSDFDYESLIRSTLEQAVEKKMIADPGIPVGVSLSGGLDSSLIAALAKKGRQVLDTFVVGMRGSEDVARSLEVAQALGTRHHVYIYDFEEMLAVLPQVILHLESFDAALVRSAIPNFFLARLAAAHVKVMLTGEGADELFGGYEYLSGWHDADRFQHELYAITANLHNTNLQRTDRMTMAHGIEGRVPFLDTQMIRMALRIPPEKKYHHGHGSEKKLLRRAFAGYLPQGILQRPKQKFSEGAGSRDILGSYAAGKVSDAEFSHAQHIYPQASLRSKEEWLYYQIFRGYFGDRIPAETVGRTRSLTLQELN